MPAATREPADDQGETLIELIIAIAIMGIAAVSIVSGIVTSILMSDVHRKESSAGAYVHDYAENVENTVAAGGYVLAANTGSYPYTPPDTRYTASITTVQCWTGSAWTGCTAGTDIGVQQLTLQVKTNTDTRASESLVVVVRKP
jgi:type II secretory pathway pseudopilin PulG